jgi:hypothetical protein
METITNVAYGDAQTRGQIRHWKKKLAERYGQFLRAYDNQNILTPITADLIKGSGGTRRGALDKLIKLFGPGATLETAEIERRNGYALWSILKPRYAVFVDTQTGKSDAKKTEAEIGSLTQDCVTVNYICVVARNGAAFVGEGLWTLEVPDHALGRAVERSGLLQPETIIREAHRSALNAPVRPDWPAKPLLKAGAGCFSIKFTGGKDISAGGAPIFQPSRCGGKEMGAPGQERHREGIENLPSDKTNPALPVAGLIGLGPPRNATRLDTGRCVIVLV